MPTIKMSSLLPHHRESLQEILSSSGVSFRTNNSVTLRILCDSVNSGNMVDPSCQPTIGLLSSKYPLVFKSAGKLKCIKVWKPKGTTIPKLLSKIEHFYNDHYLSEILKKSSTTNSNTRSAPTLLVKHIQDRVGLLPLVEQSLLELINSVDMYRKSHMDIDIFGRFLDGFYDDTDLLFFKYVRSVVIPHITQSLTIQQCSEMSRKIFGYEQEAVHEALMNSLMGELGQQPPDGGTPADTGIDSSYFVYLALWVFHHQRPDIAPTVAGSASTGAKLPSNWEHIEQCIESITNYKTAVKEFNEARRDSVPNSTRDPPSSSHYDKENNHYNRHDETPSRSPAKEPLNDIDIEAAVSQILAEACRTRLGAFTEGVQFADQLMQCVMNDNEQLWDRLCFEWSGNSSKSDHYTTVAKRRDELIDSVSTSDPELIRRSLWEFCDALATTPALQYASSVHRIN